MRAKLKAASEAKKAAKLEIMKRGVRFMLNRDLARGLSVWRQAVAPQDDPMSRGTRYFMNRTLARGWVGWHSWWSIIARKRSAMTRGLSYMLNRRLSRGWVTPRGCDGCAGTCDG